MPRRFAPVLLVLALATGAGVYFATQLHFAYPKDLREPLGIALIVNLVYYWLWGAAVPVVLLLARRYPLDLTGWKKNLAAHTGASLLLTAVQIAIAASLLRFVWVFVYPNLPIRPLGGTLFGALRINFHSSYPTYWVILFAYLTFDYAAKYRDRALHAAQLEGRLAEARLQALRMQLNPHFLFNTLNSISSLMYSDVEAADAMMTRLSELLRLTLNSNGRPETSLRQELEMLNRYIEIERIRFEERLRVSLDVDPAALDAGVPAFSLQPLVENAIRHAIAARATGGSLAISARRDNGSVRIRLHDDGPGLPPGQLREGVGLANTRARLQQLYGDAHSFVLSSPPGGGFEVTMVLPYHPAPE
jgi:two-component system, LytTR family, sensor kinase